MYRYFVVNITIQALCNALDCTLSDFCQVLPDAPAAGDIQFGESTPHHLYDPHEVKHASFDASNALVKSSVDTAIHDMVLRILREQGLLPRPQEDATSATISVTMVASLALALTVFAPSLAAHAATAKYVPRWQTSPRMVYKSW
jgi:hypothetical protein